MTSERYKILIAQMASTIYAGSLCGGNSTSSINVAKAIAKEAGIEDCGQPKPYPIHDKKETCKEICRICQYEMKGHFCGNILPCPHHGVTEKE